MKIYGKDETELVLSEKAKAAYDATDPLEIVEYYLPGRIINQRWVHGRMAYDMKGVFEAKQLTADGVIDFLESWADDMQALSAEMEGGGT